jgi:hypothetical protein
MKLAFCSGTPILYIPAGYGWRLEGGLHNTCGSCPTTSLNFGITYQVAGWPNHPTCDDLPDR